MIHNAFNARATCEANALGKWNMGLRRAHPSSVHPSIHPSEEPWITFAVPSVETEKIWLSSEEMLRWAIGAEWPFRMPVGFLKREIRRREEAFFFLKTFCLFHKSHQILFFSPRKDGVPHAYEPVQASSDQQAVLLAKVERLDAFVNGEDPLVARRPQLWDPAQLHLLGLGFVDSLSDLTQLLLSVCQWQHTAWKTERSQFVTRPEVSIDTCFLMWG